MVNEQASDLTYLLLLQFGFLRFEQFSRHTHGTILRTQHEIP